MQPVPSPGDLPGAVTTFPQLTTPRNLDVCIGFLEAVEQRFIIGALFVTLGSDQPVNSATVPSGKIFLPGDVWDGRRGNDSSSRGFEVRAFDTGVGAAGVHAESVKGRLATA